MASSPEEMLKTMIANLATKTGKSLAEWVGIAQKSGFKKHGQIVKMLKAEHEMTHGYANLVASEALKSDEPVDLVAAQYSGGKAGLRPLYDRLMAALDQMGSEIEIAPKKTCVSLRRTKQFAVITPATKTRIDLGINLKGFAGTNRLIAQSGAMCTHKIAITEEGDLDQELFTWLRQAYEQA